MSNNRTIFIIEESAVVRKVLKQHLEQLNFKVQDYVSAQSALSIFEMQKPHVVFIDCVTLDIEGFALIAKIRALESTTTTHIIMIHYEYDVGMLAKGLHLGANDYLLKPFDYNHIKEKLENLK